MKKRHQNMEGVKNFFARRKPGDQLSFSGMSKVKKKKKRVAHWNQGKSVRNFRNSLPR